ncbi:MAG: hypothetical protein JJE40_09935 [Vicinamibacteria bacterium]|nr:hypothetical protein [Vicinamibacteria bacterium]
MAEPTDVDRELRMLEIEMRRLEAEYNMYFAGRSPRPPAETRRRVTGMVRQLDRQHLSNYAERFRFTALQSRFQSFLELWDRALRARDEGRPGPFAARPADSSAAGSAPSGSDPSRSLGKKSTEGDEL